MESPNIASSASAEASADDMPVEDVPILKTCKECGESKTLDNYYVAYRRVDGGLSYNTKCKPCISVASKKRYVRSVKKPEPEVPAECLQYYLSKYNISEALFEEAHRRHNIGCSLKQISERLNIKYHQLRRLREHLKNYTGDPEGVLI